jgi:hypothetical protein
MRTFSCFIFDRRRSIPTLSFVLASDEMRARELARRELMDEAVPLWVEIHEDGRLLGYEYAQACG